MNCVRHFPISIGTRIQICAGVKEKIRCWLIRQFRKHPPGEEERHFVMDLMVTLNQADPLGALEICQRAMRSLRWETGVCGVGLRSNKGILASDGTFRQEASMANGLDSRRYAPA